LRRRQGKRVKDNDPSSAPSWMPRLDRGIQGGRRVASDAVATAR
jgi:hypothetical protein